jgi:hypothetical protein
MSEDSIIVQPSDIAMLGDDILAHLKHFSAAEQVAIALYLLSAGVAKIKPEDNPGALALAARAMAIRLMPDSVR